MGVRSDGRTALRPPRSSPPWSPPRRIHNQKPLGFNRPFRLNTARQSPSFPPRPSRPRHKRLVRRSATNRKPDRAAADAASHGHGAGCGRSSLIRSTLPQPLNDDRGSACGSNSHYRGSWGAGQVARPSNAPLWEASRKTSEHLPARSRPAVPLQGNGRRRFAGQYSRPKLPRE